MPAISMPVPINASPSSAVTVTLPVLAPSVIDNPVNFDAAAESVFVSAITTSKPFRSPVNVTSSATFAVRVPDALMFDRSAPAVSSRLLTVTEPSPLIVLPDACDAKSCSSIPVLTVTTKLPRLAEPCSVVFAVTVADASIDMATSDRLKLSVPN